MISVPVPRATRLVVACALCLSAYGWSADPVPKSGSVAINRNLVKERLPIIAVATLESRGVGVNEAGVIADNLAAKLQQSGRFRVMERSQMQQILKEQNFQQSGACDQGQCAVEMAKLLGIDRIIIGSVGLVGSTYSMNLRLVDVATGEALRTSARNHKGTIDDVLTDMVPEAVVDLSVTSDPTAEAAPTPTALVEASRRESKGSLWPWLVGGAAVAGGATAAVLLMGGNSSSPPAATPAAATTAGTDNHLKFTW